MTVQIEELLKAFELNNPYLKFYLNKMTAIWPWLRKSPEMTRRKTK